MEKQNVTLSLPRDLLKDAKIVAIKKDTSLSKLLVQALEDIVVQYHGYEEARDAHIRILKKGFNMGTNGDITVTREEIHERG